MSNPPVSIFIDSLTDCIENVISGDVFNTLVLPVTEKDYPRMRKPKGWQFDWVAEAKNPENSVFKLTIEGNPTVIQGLVSIRDLKDHIFLNLVENAPFNFGKNKVYTGVAGNLFAYACKVSEEAGYEGYVAFKPKTKLVEHYQKTLGAEPLNRQLMFINTVVAQKLIKQYFKR